MHVAIPTFKGVVGQIVSVAERADTLLLHDAALYRRRRHQSVRDLVMIAEMQAECLEREVTAHQPLVRCTQQPTNRSPATCQQIAITPAKSSKKTKPAR